MLIESLHLDRGDVQVVNVRNDGALPLSPGRRLAVLGPNANSSANLVGDFYADPAGLCAPDGSLGCIPTMAAALAAANVGGTTVTLPGVQISANDSSWGAALAAVDAADTVVLVLGIDMTLGHEGTDRTDGIGLPAVQVAFADAVRVRAGGKPVVVVLVNHLPVSPDSLMTGYSALVETFSVIKGAPAVAAALFGASNRWGKMCVAPRARVVRARGFPGATRFALDRPPQAVDDLPVGVRRPGVAVRLRHDAERRQPGPLVPVLHGRAAVQVWRG